MDDNYDLTYAEKKCLISFFSSVDECVSHFIDYNTTAYEETITDFIGNLLSDLFFPCSMRFNSKNLKECFEKNGSNIDMIFRTNKYSRKYESTVTQADFGIIYQRGSSKPKAIIVQAKRLYNKGDKYTIDSTYDDLKPKQFRNLERNQMRYNKESTFYSFYNPGFESFDDASKEILRHFKNMGYGPGILVANLKAIRLATNNFKIKLSIHNLLRVQNEPGTIVATFPEFMVNLFIACLKGTTHRKFLKTAGGGRTRIMNNKGKVAKIRTTLETKNSIIIKTRSNKPS